MYARMVCAQPPLSMRVAKALTTPLMQQQAASMTPCYAAPLDSCCAPAALGPAAAAQVAREGFVVFFSEVFDAMFRLCADSESNVQNAVQFLDNLVKVGGTREEGGGGPAAAGGGSSACQGASVGTLHTQADQLGVGATAVT